MLNSANPTTVDVLMYHSISDGPGPTCIPAETFRAQLDVLSEYGYESVSLGDYYRWQRNEKTLPDKSVVITFDDGFLDFYEAAFPELHRLRFTATVFLPTGRMGALEDWEGSFIEHPRRLMEWSHVEELASWGIDFGGHTLTHADLTQLADRELSHEIRASGACIADHLGEFPISFAPPYGKTNVRVQGEIRRWYRVAVGVQLARARKQSDPFAIPRIEMHYFRNIRRWADFLDGHHTYFHTRRLLRHVRQRVVG